MPFVSRSGNLIIEDDVSRHVFNEKSGEMELQRKEFEIKLQLTSVGECSFDRNDPRFQELVFSGEPEKNGLHWYDTPWYRVLTNRMDDTELWRFYRKYRPSMMGESVKRDPNHEASIVYIPAIDDFQVTEFGHKKGFHLPVWLLDMIIGDGLFDSGKVRTRDNTTARWASDSECDEMLKAYEARKGREDEDTELLTKIKDEYKEMRVKERVKNLHTASSYAKTESRYEKERIMAQVVAEAKIQEKLDESLEVKKPKAKAGL